MTCRIGSKFRFCPMPVVARHRRVRFSGEAALDWYGRSRSATGAERGRGIRWRHALAGLLAPWHSAGLEGVEAEGGQGDMQTYDYVVVGAGSAGAAVANRLSADPRNKVLLLEAGRASHAWSFIPIGMARLMTNPAANWLYSSEPEASTNGRRLPVPRGKLLVGSGSINGMVFG